VCANAACPYIISYSTAAKWLDAPVSLAPANGRSLLDDLARITDPRKPRGRRHALGAVAAVLFGAARYRVDQLGKQG
jgi:hypothetical protein